MLNLHANWPAPKHIKALTTTRDAGASLGPYAHNNLALHVDDAKEHVKKNRAALRTHLDLPAEPQWLNQTHTNICVRVEEEILRDADAAVTSSTNHPLAIMTADCLPIVLCNQDGTEIAAIHAGWRGLFNGIIEHTLDKMHSPKHTLMAWTGPAICKNCFKVGQEVPDMFIKRYAFTAPAFRPHQEKYLGDLPQIAELILNQQGVEAVYHADACTLEQENRFYSYRRTSQTGRMATLIWFNQTTDDLG
ncbi:MAG: peptidoglycan editing factor PgeF [Legionellaceae bacterium]|nr:peptidoglycan editing factor PgeF [Legionellaceae bacterium]